MPHRGPPRRGGRDDLQSAMRAEPGAAGRRQRERRRGPAARALPRRHGHAAAPRRAAAPLGWRRRPGVGGGARAPRRHAPRQGGLGGCCPRNHRSTFGQRHQRAEARGRSRLCTGSHACMACLGDCVFAACAPCTGSLGTGGRRGRCRLAQPDSREQRGRRARARWAAVRGRCTHASSSRASARPAGAGGRRGAAPGGRPAAAVAFRRGRRVAVRAAACGRAGRRAAGRRGRVHGAGACGRARGVARQRASGAGPAHAAGDGRRPQWWGLETL